MPRFQRILVPIHAQRRDGYAMDVAVDLARRHSGEVFLLLSDIGLSAKPDQRYFWLLAEDEDASRVSSAGSDASVQAFAGDVLVHTAHLEGLPLAPAVLQYAVNNQSDLIVLETYAHRNLGRTVFGGTSGEIVRCAKCPVLAIRHQPSTTGEVSFNKILVPMDFSDCSRVALRIAADLATAYNSTIQLLFVDEERPTPLFRKSGPVSMTLLKRQEDVETSALEALETLHAELPAPTAPVSYAVRRGHVSKEIMDYSVANASDLIVIHSHGLTGNPEYALGSVAEKVLRRAPCPVMMLKAPHLSEIGKADSTTPAD